MSLGRPVPVLWVALVLALVGATGDELVDGLGVCSAEIGRYRYFFHRHDRLLEWHRPLSSTRTRHQIQEGSCIGTDLLVFFGGRSQCRSTVALLLLLLSHTLLSARDSSR